MRSKDKINYPDPNRIREKTLLVNDEIKQALMAAPLWKYFAENNLL